MKIYRNNVCVNLELDEFLDILESQLFEELLLLIMELDDAAPVVQSGSAFLQTAKPREDDELEDGQDDGILTEEFLVEDMNEIVDILADILAGAESGDIEVSIYEIDSGDLNQSMFSSALDGMGYVFYDTTEAAYTSEEDKKLRRIVNRYRGMVE